MLQVFKILAWSINITKSKLYPKTSSKGSRKYKLNDTHLLEYDNKTGFYKSRSAIANNQEQPASTHPWKCEKCDSLFVALKELRQHKEEYHSYQ